MYNKKYNKYKKFGRNNGRQATDADKKNSEGSVTIKTGGKEITIRNARSSSNNDKPEYKKKRNVGFDFGQIGRNMR